MSELKKLTCAAMSAVVLTFGLVVATPAHAQKQRGLVNVYVDDVLTQNKVAVPVAVSVAAAICGINAQVGVIAQQIQRSGSYSCSSDSGQTVLVQQAK